MTSAMTSATSTTSTTSRAGTVRAAARTCAAVALVVAAAAFGLLVSVLPAQAAGTSSLDKLILANPEPGWTKLSPTELNTFETDIQNELSTKNNSSQTFQTAVEGWESPSGIATASLVIFLVQAVTGSVGGPASDEATGFCQGATDQTPTAAQPISGLSEGATTTCSGEGENVVVGTGITGNYLAFVASFGSSPVPASSVGPIVVNQIAAVNNQSSSGSSSPGGSNSKGTSGTTSSSSSVPIIAGAGGGAVVVVAIVIFFVLRRRSPKPAVVGAGPMGAPSYMPVGAAPPGVGFNAPSAPPPQPGPPPANPVPDVPSYGAPPASAQSHDPWGDSDPGWLSSHEAAEAGAAQAGAAQTTSGSGGGVQQAPGWYQDAHDAQTMRYWDGSSYTGRRRWDGSNWVDA